MNGSLAALIDLALRANVWLAASPSSLPPDLASLDDTFKYVKSITVTLSGTPVVLPKATGGVEDWFNALRESGAQQVKLVFDTPRNGDTPRLASALADGGSWGLIADGARPTMWVARWETANLLEPDGRIWDITLMTKESGVSAEAPDVQTSSLELRAALSGLGDFASRHHQHDWAAVMSKAIDQLDSPNPTCAYYPEMVPVGALPLDRLRLLAAATHGWVFGGMGSWNDDVVTSDHEDYERVTSRLWDALLLAMTAAIN